MLTLQQVVLSHETLDRQYPAGISPRASEGAWNAARLWMGQALLSASLFAYLNWVRGDTGSGGFRLLAAGLAAVPALLLSNAFLITATRFTSAQIRLHLQDDAFFYSLSATVGAFLVWRFLAFPDIPKRALILSGIACSCLLLCCALFPAAVGIFFGPNLVICIAACILLALSAFIQHARDRMGAGRSFGRALGRVLLGFAGPLLTIWFLIGLSQNTHVVRTFPSDDLSLQEYANWRLPVDHSLVFWYDQHKGQGDVVPMLLVESAGGGLRAAYWTTSVLTTLDAVEGFRDHLFVISSVSGGSLGATVYRAAMTARVNESAQGPLNLESMRKFYTHDFLGPLTAGWLFSDVASNLVPWNVFPDRAEALERSWEHAWREDWHNNLFGNEFRHLWPPAASTSDPVHPLPRSRWPHLVLNGASLVNGNVLETLAPAIVLDQMRQRNGVLFSKALAWRPDIAAYFHFGIGPVYLTDDRLRRDEPVPSLNWALSQRSMRQIDDYLSQCEHLQTRELEKLLHEPEKAAENTRIRIKRTSDRAARMTREQMGPLCR
jgi:hypothetical protein